MFITLGVTIEERKGKEEGGKRKDAKKGAGKERVRAGERRTDTERDRDSLLAESVGVWTASLAVVATIVGLLAGSCGHHCWTV